VAIVVYGPVLIVSKSGRDVGSNRRELRSPASADASSCAALRPASASPGLPRDAACGSAGGSIVGCGVAVAAVVTGTSAGAWRGSRRTVCAGVA